MEKPDFVYVTYIATTPEKLWEALVQPALMRQYWIGITADSTAHENISDWQVGSRWEHRRVDDAGTVDIVGRVTEYDPPHRLAFTWARPGDEDDDSKHSHVSFELEPQGNTLVKLTVTHEGLRDDPKMLAGISGGWPQILSHLKTFLETGHALPRG